MKIFNLFFLLLFLSCSSGKKEKLTITGETMGTYYRVVLYSSEKPERIKADIDKFLELFNKIFSTYIADSEISKINRTKFDKIKISDSMNKALSISLEVSRKSLGYFDVTVGPVVNAWGFGPDGKRKKPTDEEVKSLMDKVGYELIEIKNKFLHLKKPGIYLDLSAIAKGFGVDELVKYLEYQGHSKLLVEIGGEVRTRGTKVDGSAWKLGIEGPSQIPGQKLAKIINLSNLSMATSGSYRNYIQYGDEVFQHTIDPKTGYPAKHKTISVSVISEYCADADAWATALMSLGHEKGLELANKNDLKVLFQVKNGEDITLISTRAFDKYINEQGKL